MTTGFATLKLYRENNPELLNLESPVNLTCMSLVSGGKLNQEPSCCEVVVHHHTVASPPKERKYPPSDSSLMQEHNAQVASC